ncbi:MAG: hypothetical protein Q9195_005702 [Heterodermia aff. obscurata]
MAVRVQHDIVRLQIPVHNPLPVYIPQRAGELRHPKSDCIFCKSLSGNVEAQVAAIHQVNDEDGPNVPASAALELYFERSPIGQLETMSAIVPPGSVVPEEPTLILASGPCPYAPQSAPSQKRPFPPPAAVGNG